MQEQFFGNPEEFRKLVERARSPSHDPLGDEIKETLKSYIDTGSIVVISENQFLFDLIETKFPISVNRIDWSKVDNNKLFDLTFMEDGTIEKRSLISCQEELKEWLREWGVSFNRQVIYCGDNTHIALKMSLQVFMECLVDKDLAREPQHGYVIPDECDWCIQICREGYIYGGRADDSQAVGEEKGEA